MSLRQMTAVMLNISLCPQTFDFLQLLIYSGCSRHAPSNDINIDLLVTVTLTQDGHAFPCSLHYLFLHWRQIDIHLKQFATDHSIWEVGDIEGLNGKQISMVLERQMCPHPCCLVKYITTKFYMHPPNFSPELRPHLVTHAYGFGLVSEKTLKCGIEYMFNIITEHLDSAE